MSGDKARRVSIHDDGYIAQYPDGTHMLVPVEVWERVITMLEGVTHGCWDASEAAALVTEIGGGDERTNL